MSYPQPPVARNVTRPTWVIVAAIILVLALVAAAVGLFVMSVDEDRTFAAPEPTGEKAPEGLEKFYAQKIRWSDCGTAKCGWVQVPVDYEEPSKDTLKLAIRLYPGREAATKSILVNPGGPGGSAVDFAASMSTSFASKVTSRYNIVGVDPRGVGTSTPLQCLGDEAMDEFVDNDPEPDSEAELADIRSSIKEMSQACAKNSGDLASHVSTVEVARDMDIVRALLGEEKLNWYGASYGTQIGATYASQFPKKVGRMVLDAAVDPSLDAFESALGQTVGFQRAFDSYAADCAKSDSCAVGASVAEARDTMKKFLDDLERQPMKDESGRELTLGRAFYGIALPLYSQDSWSYLTEAMDAALNDDDPSQLLTLADAYFDRKGGKYLTNGGQVIYAVNCLDSGSRPTEAQVRSRIAEFEKASPIFGKALGWGVLGCTDWSLKATTPQGDVRAEEAPPIVVLGTTRDPATPYEWSQALADQLGTGVLVSRDGDGHGAYSAGNECIDRIVDTFLTDGTVPKKGTEC